MNTKRRRLFARFETALSALSGVLAVLTIFWRDWIEAVSGWDPDAHNGSAEVVVIVVLALISVLSGLLARRTQLSFARHTDQAQEPR